MRKAEAPAAARVPAAVAAALLPHALPTVPVPTVLKPRRTSLTKMNVFSHSGNLAATLRTSFLFIAEVAKGAPYFSAPRAGSMSGMGCQDPQLFISEGLPRSVILEARRDSPSRPPLPCTRSCPEICLVD